MIESVSIISFTIHSDFIMWIPDLNSISLHMKMIFGGSCRVTLVVAFGFLLQIFRRWHEPINCTFSFYECRLSGWDTQRWWGHSNPTCSYQLCLNSMHSEAIEMQQHFSHAYLCPLPHLCPNEPPVKTFQISRISICR